MLFELYFLRDVVDESLKIETQNFSQRSESSFDPSEVALQQQRCKQQLLRNIVQLSEGDFRRETKPKGVIEDEDVFSGAEIKARDNALNKLIYQSEVNLALAQFTNQQ